MNTIQSSFSLTHMGIFLVYDNYMKTTCKISYNHCQHLEKCALYIRNCCPVPQQHSCNLANNNSGVKSTTGIRNSDASILVLHLFPAFNHPNNHCEHISTLICPPWTQQPISNYFQVEKILEGHLPPPCTHQVTPMLDSDLYLTCIFKEMIHTT